MTNKILRGVDTYYTHKVTEFGLTPQGVDWNSKESQYLRFRQLSLVFRPDDEFKILDFGCGYGEYYDFLCQMLPDQKFIYSGYDISEAMISHARQSHGELANAFFFNSLPDESYDYVIASGVFNVRLDLANDEDWKAYIVSVLKTINEKSVKGFSFNALTKYSDPERMLDYLYYADPLWLFDYCKLNFSKNVALLHDYDLYEFTILVRK